MKCLALTKGDDFCCQIFSWYHQLIQIFPELSLGTMFAPMAAMIPMLNVPQNLEHMPRPRPTATAVQGETKGSPVGSSRF